VAEALERLGFILADQGVRCSTPFLAQKDRDEVLGDRAPRLTMESTFLSLEDLPSTLSRIKLSIKGPNGPPLQRDGDHKGLVLPVEQVVRFLIGRERVKVSIQWRRRDGSLHSCENSNASTNALTYCWTLFESRVGGGSIPIQILKSTILLNIIVRSVNCGCEPTRWLKIPSCQRILCLQHSLQDRHYPALSIKRKVAHVLGECLFDQKTETRCG